jgi:transposase
VAAALPARAAAPPTAPAYNTEQLTWRHLNFFQHQAFLHARVPRVRCICCGFKQVAVP